ncbi:hypothetical protein [Henriciella mobilis]|uniref:Uncharacterized protein n=1 Tax=Henriciella mobilis TaxID=2305467 RepID=A0A399RR22_9PROT|nr:hypothetical protein [Henriciella mobilis]RIJ32312.1 hypothetical protein D1223_00135 [Henriciella mobilis]
MSDPFGGIVRADRVEELKREIAELYRDRGVDGLIATIAPALASIEKLEEANADLDASLTSLTKKMKLLEQAHRIETAVHSVSDDAYVDEMSIVAEMAFEDDAAFHGLEYTSEGEPFRWLGPDKTSSITAFIDRSKPRTVTVRILTFSLGSENELLSLMDGESQAWDEVVADEMFTTYNVTLEPLKKQRPTRLAFRSKIMLRPSETYENNTDDRFIGVAFSKLTVR